MKAAVYDRHGDFDVLTIEDVAPPEVGDDEVCIRVRAVSLNGFDPMMVKGSTGLKTPFPMSPCGDCSGEIVSLGANVTGWKVGDRVSPFPILPDVGMMGEVALGAARELVSVPASVLTRVPDNVSHEHAAALPCAYGTALRMMTKQGRVEAGDKVLILGAGGGVGVACIQIAKMAGAHVIAAATGAHKGEKLRSVGADETIDTGAGSWRKQVIEAHGKPAYYGGPGGIDVLVNYVGGDTFSEGQKVVRKHGQILVCGASASYDPKIDLRYLWSFEHKLIGSNGWTLEDQAELLGLVGDGKLTPAIDSVRPIEEIAQAMSDLAERRVVGKAVLTL